MPAMNAAWGGAILTVTVDGDDVSCDVMELVVDRSKNRLWDPPDAGTCQLTLNLNLGGQPATAGQVGDLVRVKFAYGSVNRWLFTGLVQRRRLEHNPDRDLLVLDCVDEFDQLARLNLRAGPSDVGVGAGEDVDARIGRWLDEAGSSSPRALGDSEMTCPATLIDGNVLRQLQATALSDGGDLFIAGDGTVTFLPWRWRDDSTATAALFSDRKLHDWVPYSAVAYHDDLDEVQNKVVGTRREPDEDKSPQTATNAGSITAYGERGDALDDLELENDTQVATRVANVVEVAASPNPRFDSIVIQPAFTPSRSWPRVIPVTFGSLVAANRIWADGTQSALYGHVIGEKWVISPTDATVTFRCSGTGTWDATGSPPRTPIALERCPDGSLRIPPGYPCDDLSDVVIKDADGNVLATYPPGSLCECGVVFPPDDGTEICLDNGSGTLVCIPIDDERLDAILWVDAFEPAGPMIERITGQELTGGPGWDSVELDVIDPGDYDAIWANNSGGVVAAGESEIVDAASFSGGWTVQFYLWVPGTTPGAGLVRYLLSIGEAINIVLTTEYSEVPFFEQWSVEVRVWDADDVLHLSGPLYTPIGELWHQLRIGWTGSLLLCFVDGLLVASKPWDDTSQFAPRAPTALYAVELPDNVGVGELLVWADARLPIGDDYDSLILASLPKAYWKLDDIEVFTSNYDFEVLEDAPKAYWKLDDIETAMSAYDVEVLGDAPKAYWTLDAKDTVTPTAYDTQVAALSPVHFWKLDEASSPFANSGSAGTSATLSGTNATVTGPLGTARSFNGSTYLSVASLNLPNAPITIEAVVNVTAGATSRNIIGGQGDYTFRVNTTDTLSLLSGGVANLVTTTPAITEGVWIHVAVTKTSGQVPKIYIDGVVVPGSGATTDATGGGGSNPTVIGASNLSGVGVTEHFNGGISRLAVYSSVLTEAQIAAHAFAATAT